MSILQSKKQIQPKWPLQIDPIFGPYKSVSSAAESLKQDFLFLLKTIPGEWPMNPDLGVGLAKYLFENYGSQDLYTIKGRIDNQLRKYLSNITLREAKFINTDSDKDNMTSVLRIKFFINDLGLEDTIDFGLDSNRKTLVKIDVDKQYNKIGDL
tara:strand:+ start:4846 stop:5307 length:462 start_codon:yes stop_codon:yes gene_type:complete